MKRAWKAIKKLVNKDAKHIKKGKCLSQFNDTQILSHAAEEIVELMAEPDNPEELGDILACLYHYAIKHGWSKDMIEEHILIKLEQRFE